MTTANNTLKTLRLKICGTPEVLSSNEWEELATVLNTPRGLAWSISLDILILGFLNKSTKDQAIRPSCWPTRQKRMAACSFAK